MAYIDPDMPGFDEIDGNASMARKRDQNRRAARYRARTDGRTGKIHSRARTLAVTWVREHHPEIWEACVKQADEERR